MFVYASVSVIEQEHARLPGDRQLEKKCRLIGFNYLCAQYNVHGQWS